jgi:hypothetical protein
MVLLFLALCKRSGTASLNEVGPYSLVIVTTARLGKIIRNNEISCQFCEQEEGATTVSSIAS